MTLLTAEELLAWLETTSTNWRALATPSLDWETPIEFKTRSAGILLASRRTILIHALMHSIRHYAQLATLVRQHGIKPNWPMDYLFMGATRP